MRAMKFKFKDQLYELTLERQERAEGDKFHPFAASVSGQVGGPIRGTFQVTDDALKRAEEQGGESAEDVLATAFGKSLASELVIRKLKMDFSCVIDPRWIS